MTTNNDTLAPNGKPKVVVPLVGKDGNAFFIIGRVTRAMRAAKWTPGEIAVYLDAAKASDYDNLLRVTMDYSVEPDEDKEDSDDDE